MTYPILLHPNTADSSSLVKFVIFTNGKNKKTGASELVAFSHIMRLGLDCILENISVTINGQRYEPDLVYINKEKGIYVDIEIDEPYSGGHHPTHYITSDGTHKDNRRNETFRNAGWHVLRFTEQQMFCQTAECMRFLFELLINLGAMDALPRSLSKATQPKSEPCRTANEAKALSCQNYRKTYLGYNPIKMDLVSHLRCCQLIVPILIQSITNKRIRRMMMKQLKGFFDRY